MLTGGAVVAGAALSVGAVAAVAAVAFDQYGQLSSQGDALAAQAAKWAPNASMADLLKGQAAVLKGAKDLQSQVGFNPLASAGFQGLNAAAKVIADAIAAKQIPRSGGTGGNVGSDLYPSQVGGLKAVNQLSGGMSGLLAGGKIGPAGVGMANSIASIFAQSTSPSLKSMTSAMLQFRDTQARYLAQGDTKLAASIGVDLAAVRAAIDRDTATLAAKTFTATVNAATGFTTGKTEVKAAVTVRDVVTNTATSSRYGPTRKIV
jgi:hypothetical protein